MAGVDLIQQQGKKFDSLSVTGKDIYSEINAALYALYACTCTVYSVYMYVCTVCICRFCRVSFWTARVEGKKGVS